MRGSRTSGEQDHESAESETNSGECNSGADAHAAPGLLKIVGLGPGDFCLLPPLAQEALQNADVIVGYTAYLDLVPEDYKKDKIIYSSGMKKEMERATQAIEFALSGKETVMISSGDAGIYGMAGLILELLEKRGLLDTLPCEIVPGIPALCAAAALLGAPLMHDFAVISLSDLLTPWERIEKRLEAAAAADFSIILYNPRSKRRTGQLERALEIISAHRTPETPVGLVRNAYREEQFVRAQPLSDFRPEDADMLSIVLIGNSSSRLAGNRIITPRGYMEKYSEKC